MAASFSTVLAKLLLPFAVRWLRDRGYISSAKALIIEFGLDVRLFFEDIQTYHEPSDFPNYEPPKTVIPTTPPDKPEKSTFLGFESENSYPK